MTSVYKTHMRRFFLEFFNLFFNREWVWRFIGVLNKHSHFIKGVFLVYPATSVYALAYLYPSRIQKVMWSPWPSGVLWQNGRMSLMFCITASDKEFLDPTNDSLLREAVIKIEKLCHTLHVERHTFAGVLPGVLLFKRITREAPEADLTARVIIQAIELIKVRESLCPQTPVIVLGGKGFIGRRVVKLLAGSVCYSIDLKKAELTTDVWPIHLRGKRVIVVNITLKDALLEYVEQMWPGIVVINEVYPEPSSEILDHLTKKGCLCYHVVGVQGSAIPSFPEAYTGAIPCCAAWLSKEILVVVRKMNHLSASV